MKLFGSYASSSRTGIRDRISTPSCASSCLNASAVFWAQPLIMQPFSLVFSSSTPTSLAIFGKYAAAAGRSPIAACCKEVVDRCNKVCALFCRLPALRFHSIILLYLVDQIAQDCACGRQLSGTTTIEHGLVHAVAPYHNCIEYAVYMGNQALVHHYHRHNRRQDLSVFQTLDCADQLDCAAEILCQLYIFQGDVADTLGVYLIRINVLAEYQRGQNADLPAGVVSVYVGGGSRSA